MVSDKPKFNFGDYVFHARLESTTEQAVCPDCDGDRYLTMIYKGETFTFDCEGCRRGWMGSTGTRDRYIYAPSILEGNVEGVERDIYEPHGFEYRMRSGSNSFWILKEEDTFATREEAEARVIVLKAERDEAEAKRILAKTKPTRSWIWHIRYYQGEIRRAQETIERATLQLNAARKHAKKTA